MEVVDMVSLEKKIIAEGKIGEGDILKVDCFLNHQIDVNFLQEIGKEFYNLFGNCGVNKILTIEASGIGIACITAQFFNCPVVFAKKSKTINISGDVYVTRAYSYTHQCYFDVTVSREFLGPKDRVLIIDDFLAKGSALEALVALTNIAGCELVGAGIVIEKAYQGGGDAIRKKGIRVESLAKISSMSQKDGIKFI